MYLIGLTGNIACGKSSVAALLARLGAEVIDADQLAHEAMRAGTPVAEAIVGEFGPEVADAEGNIDRRRLGRIVFADSDAMKRLEAIVHPAVRERRLELLAKSTAAVVVLESVKLFEVGLDGECDEVWVVTCPRRLQVKRLMTTRGLTEEEAQERVDAQSPTSEKVQAARVVIDNSATQDALKRKVQRQWQRVRVEARCKRTAGKTEA